MSMQELRRLTYILGKMRFPVVNNEFWYPDLVRTYEQERNVKAENERVEKAIRGS